MPRRPQFVRNRAYQRRPAPPAGLLSNNTIQFNRIRPQNGSTMGLSHTIAELCFFFATKLSGAATHPNIRVSRRVVMPAEQWLTNAAKSLEHHLLRAANEAEAAPNDARPGSPDAEALLVSARQLLRDGVLSPRDLITAPAESPLQADGFRFDGIDVSPRASEAKEGLEGKGMEVEKGGNGAAGAYTQLDHHHQIGDPLYHHPRALAGPSQVLPGAGNNIVAPVAPPTPPPSPDSSFWALPAISPEPGYDIADAIEQHGTALLGQVTDFYSFVGEQPKDFTVIWIDTAARFYVPTEAVQALAKTARAVQSNGGYMPIWLSVLGLNMSPTIYGTALGEANVFTSLTTHVHLIGSTDHFLNAKILLSGELPDFGDLQLKPAQLLYVVWLDCAGPEEPAILIVAFANGQLGVGLREWFVEARVKGWLEDWAKHEFLLPFPL